MTLSTEIVVVAPLEGSSCEKDTLVTRGTEVTIIAEEPPPTGVVQASAGLGEAQAVTTSAGGPGCASVVRLDGPPNADGYLVSIGEVELSLERARWEEAGWSVLIEVLARDGTLLAGEPRYGATLQAFEGDEGGG